IVNLAQAEVYAVAEKRGGEDYHPLSELLEPTMDEIEHAAGSSGEMVGVPTGFTDLDELTNGLHAGQMIIVAARPAVGSPPSPSTSPGLPRSGTGCRPWSSPWRWGAPRSPCACCRRSPRSRSSTCARAP